MKKNYLNDPKELFKILTLAGVDFESVEEMEDELDLGKHAFYDDFNDLLKEKEDNDYFEENQKRPENLFELIDMVDTNDHYTELPDGQILELWEITEIERAAFDWRARF